MSTAKVTELKQLPGSINCYSVCMAMALGKSVEEIESKLLPAIAPYSDQDMYRLMIQYGYSVGFIFSNIPYSKLFNEDNVGFQFRIKDIEAFIAVESETIKNGSHAIYWRNNKVYDPNPNTENGRDISSYRITEILPVWEMK